MGELDQTQQDPPFVKLQKGIVKHRQAILASIKHDLANGRIESMNTKI